MDEIITNGSVTAASSPGFRMQDKTFDTAVDMEDAECNEEEVKEEELAEVEPSAKGRNKKKRLANARTGEPRIKWTPKKEECLVEAWKTISLDPITVLNQNSNTY
ncbi:Rho GTPase-activating protein 24 [Hordeum vulgare]|nr:Rho GTPase-activating protein 24 [Hordeum vulgare]